MPHSVPKHVYCLTLGCSKNKADSELIAGALADAGAEVVREVELADVAIVNTCGFIRSAVEENISEILGLIQMKKEGHLALVGVVGCLVARYGDELKLNLPEVDFWAGCDDIKSILGGLSLKSRNDAAGRQRLPGDTALIRYLKISEGCDKACSYCAIPSIKGPARSRAVRDLVDEAGVLARDGAAEICLVAQDLSSYGADRGEAGGLISLLDVLESSIPPHIWLRLLYLQPSGVDRALLERVANGRQVLPYLDIPVQHSVPRILELMNRGGGCDNLPWIFETARAIRPDFALRTTCMVGFPGETRADFANLLKFIGRIRPDRLGAFEFSPEEGTPAAEFPGQVSRRVKRARMERLMSLQEDISLSRQEMFVGRELDVMIDSVGGGGYAEGRSFREAPEVDGIIELSGVPSGVSPGDIIKAAVTGAFEHDLEATALAKE
ncbi:MAG: 30S ribosomal protein S12 methylthiotransferase RimO [Synergistaceae bacterium]|jgi:ribosomal protein S12 methylthiotransferase|nr:30S ribosomal protein S12 methylthiotransferase RimO [Synergistaceae bacterium]